ncbi:MAG: SRPBCC family protein [Geminicoccaceae bacterium]|nr:SRPBCC family protein [Geminicoccaceae bacterium]
MRVRGIAAGLAIIVAAAPSAAVEVRRSVEVAAPPAEVWELIGDVCSIADWHPVIASCIREEDDRALYRILQTEDGSTLHEQIMQVDDDARFYKYSILEGPLPVRGYVSTLSVGPGADDDGSLVIWQSDFSSLGMTDEEAAGIIAGIYDAGLEALADRFAE